MHKLCDGQITQGEINRQEFQIYLDRRKTMNATWRK